MNTCGIYPSSCCRRCACLTILYELALIIGLFLQESSPRLNRASCRFSSLIILLICATVKWCLDNGISSQITTPVSEQDLASALISALESNTVTPVVAENDVPYDILIAEDNLVNQKLAVKILEKYGHQVEIAENGQLAVDAFKARVQRNRPFDVILVSLDSLSIHCL